MLKLLPLLMTRQVGKGYQKREQCGIAVAAEAAEAVSAGGPISTLMCHWQRLLFPLSGHQQSQSSLSFEKKGGWGVSSLLYERIELPAVTNSLLTLSFLFLSPFSHFLPQTSSASVAASLSLSLIQL